MARNTSRPLLTAREFSRDPAYRKGWELWDGGLMVRDWSGGQAQVVTVRVVERLSLYVRRRGLGWVTASSQGFLVARNPDRVLSADAAYTSKARLPEVPERGCVLCPPDFAVEVRSPTDTWEKIVARCTVWVQHHTSVAWGIDPIQRLAVVLRKDSDPELARPGAVITAAPALPRFRMKVADLFLRGS